MLGAALTGVAAFALFPLVDTGNFWLSALGISAGLSALGMMYGPQAAFFTELFSTEVRYSGASLGYQLGAIVGEPSRQPLPLFSGLSTPLSGCLYIWLLRR